MSPPLWCMAARSGAAAALRQRGFSLPGLVVALALSTMAAIWASGQVVQRIEDAAARATGVWLTQIRLALTEVLARHSAILAMGDVPRSEQGVPLFADPLAPTVGELRGLGLLPADFPEQSSMGFSAQLQIVRSQACPGERCRMDGLVYSATPLLKTGTQSIDLTGIAAVIDAAGGYGGAVWPASPGLVRGAAFSFANPGASGGPAYAPGTLALWAGAEAGGPDLDRYVRIRDTRDPQLQGELSVASSAQVGSYLTVGARASAGQQCSVATGAMATSEQGELLTCQSRVWGPASGGFGGAYSFNNPLGCYHYSGTSTANPRTGACSCPAGYKAVIVSAGGKWTETEGWTTGYVCVR
ncbi:prepilin [Achromobacter sp.]|uniref:type II secretion system protein n=1 Tax=Achromobacter sp. TaxID=134375 RepID=UPI003C72E805